MEKAKNLIKQHISELAKLGDFEIKDIDDYYSNEQWIIENMIPLKEINWEEIDEKKKLFVKSINYIKDRKLLKFTVSSYENYLIYQYAELPNPWEILMKVFTEENCLFNIIGEKEITYQLLKL